MVGSAAASGRTADGRFRGGVSGNPAGRPKGSSNWKTRFVEAFEAGEGEAIARAVIEAALAGDRRCLLFCAAQLFPKPRGCPVDLGVPEALEGEPAALLDAALRAVARGEISAVEGLDVARLVDRRERAARAAAPVSGLYPGAAAERAENASGVAGGTVMKPPSRGAAPGRAAPVATARPVGARPTVATAAAAAATAPRSPASSKPPVVSGGPASVLPPGRGDLLGSCSAAALAA